MCRSQQQLRDNFAIRANDTDIFLDMFEDELRNIAKPLNFERLMMDSSLLLPPVDTPLTGIELRNRLPCGDGERMRVAIRAFLLVRQLACMLRRRDDPVPVLDWTPMVALNDVLDLRTCCVRAACGRGVLTGPEQGTARCLRARCRTFRARFRPAAAPARNPYSLYCWLFRDFSSWIRCALFSWRPI